MDIRKDLEEFFPVWSKLSHEEQDFLVQGCTYRSVGKDIMLHSGIMDCIGLTLVKKGRLRAYIVSENGREITLYRLFERDMCLFTSACEMPNIQFDVNVETEEESEIIIISQPVFEKLKSSSIAVANYTNEVMAGHFSEVMWLVEQIMFRSFDSRLADFLQQQSNIEGSLKLNVTHEKIAKHMGTAREVVTRMLKYFQNEGTVKLYRGGIEILNPKGLKKIIDKD